MKEIIQQYRVPIAFTAFLLLASLMVIAGYYLFPPTLWTKYTTPRMPINVTAVPIGTVSKPLLIERKGSINKAIVVPINAEFAANLSEIYVTEGQVVKAGQPLFKLQAVSVSEASPVEGQTTEAAKRLQDNYDNALKDFNRYQKLYDQGAIPRRQFESAVARLQEAKESLNNDQKAAAPQKGATATTVNDSATIKAPIDGIVTGLATTPGTIVQAGQQLMALGSGQELEVVVPIGQNDLYLLHLGTKVTIEVANQTIMGQVSRIYPVVEAASIPSFLAYIKLGKYPSGVLTPEMTAIVRIDTTKSATVFVVPAVAISSDLQGQNFIYIVNNGIAARRQVSVGATNGDIIEVNGGVPSDAIVITSSLDKIKNGYPITVIQ